LLMRARALATVREWKKRLEHQAHSRPCHRGRLRASSRDGGGVVNRPPSPLTMLLSRHTRRREAIALLGCAAAWPLAGQAQGSMPLIGFMSSRSPGESATVVTAFRQGLAEAGFLEGRNVAITFRWAEGRYAELPQLAAELVSLKVAVLLAAGGMPSAEAAKAASSTIPVVFSGRLTRSDSVWSGASVGPAATSPAWRRSRTSLVRSPSRS
jgi:hypothetical protein